LAAEGLLHQRLLDRRQRRLASLPLPPPIYHPDSTATTSARQYGARGDCEVNGEATTDRPQIAQIDAEVKNQKGRPTL